MVHRRGGEPADTHVDRRKGCEAPPPSSCDRLLSRLGAGPLVDIESDKIKGVFRRWARAVVTRARQLNLGAWPE
uniref:Uncharacterized protein n=1 Tax=Oryza brachyantha TaxID=4533 RepID=J3L3B8_ORYBR